MRNLWVIIRVFRPIPLRADGEPKFKGHIEAGQLAFGVNPA